jgi:hypothetical protein
MNIFDKFLHSVSYKFPKGYPDMSSPTDISLLESLINEVLGENNIFELKKPYESLSPKAKETAAEIIKALNLTTDNIKAHSSNRIIILTDIPRSKIFQQLEELGYIRDITIPGSSAGGFRAPNSVEIIEKSKSLTAVGGAGVENENIFTNNINKYASEDDPITVIIYPKEGETLKYENVIGARHVGKEGEKLGYKGDSVIITNRDSFPISIKKDGPFRWESAMTRYAYLYDKFMSKAYNDEIPNLKLLPDPLNPKVLQMINPDNNKPYGRIYVTDAPELENQLPELVFGKDKAMVVQKTFTDSDFRFQDDILTISSTKNIISLDDLKEKDLPVIEFERNASKATKLDGYRGRGIVLRISPKGNMPGETSKANNLTLTYDQTMS